MLLSGAFEIIPKLWKYFGKSDCASYEKSLMLAPQINQQDIVLLDNSIHKQNKIKKSQNNKNNNNVVPCFYPFY